MVTYSAILSIYSVQCFQWLHFKIRLSWHWLGDEYCNGIGLRLKKCVFTLTYTVKGLLLLWKAFVMLFACKQGVLSDAVVKCAE